jgi:putative inorganic carbon (HCO3(-)) transporter
VDKITQYYPVPVHSVYLQLAAEIGIPGLLFFLGFIGHIFIRSILFIRRGKGLSETVLIGLLGGITGFLINGLVENSSLGNYYLLTLWSFSGIAVGIIEQKKRDERMS